LEERLTRGLASRGIGLAAASGAVADTGIDVLDQARFFSGLAPAQRARIAGLSTLKSFPQDTSIYLVGDPVEDFYVLSDGTVRFTLGLGKRETSAGEIIRRGDVFGWAALVEGHSQRIATAYCLTACDVVAISGKRLLELMERDHSLGYALMKQLAALLTSELVAFAAG
jgi:toluene monooxygenase system ferredoxin subunit